MKNITLLLFTILIFACTKQTKDSDNDSVEISFDSLKAAEYGADQYGMKKYVMAFLKSGKNRDQDSTTAAELQKAHLKNITRMAEEGTLLLAGPFLDDGEVRGIYIFDVETIEEARTLTETDPAIKAGRLEMDLRPWYGSAALNGMYDLSKSLVKKSISE